MKIFFNTRKSMLRKEKFTKIFFIYRCRPPPGKEGFSFGPFGFCYHDYSSDHQNREGEKEEKDGL